MDRRDFLKKAGLGTLAGIITAGCKRIPVEKVIPYIIKPEEITPGVPLWYASTFFDGREYCSVLVKTREGRPIKIEGNELSKVTFGGTSARVQASIFELYDSDRLKYPMINRRKATWDEIDEQVKFKLEQIKLERGKICILSPTIISPSTRKIISEFIKSYPGTKHIIYDTISSSPILMANKRCFGRAVIPDYKFEKAKIIVSFGADFLGTWISPIEYASRYVTTRKPGRGMSRHIQFESYMSLTGSNADIRIPIKPSEEGLLVLSLYNKLARLAGKHRYKDVRLKNDLISKIANELWKNRGRALVISGSDDIDVQIMINAINLLLDSYGNTIDLNKFSQLRQGIDSEIYQLVEDMNDGRVDALILYNVNPVYDFPYPESFISGLKKVKLTISFSLYLDETSSLVEYVCPDNHYLESWNDAEPKKEHFSLTQPVIQPLFNTRQAQESLLIWMDNYTDYYTYIKEYWRENIFPLQRRYKNFERFWNKCLHDGIFKIERKKGKQPRFNYNISESVKSIFKKFKSSNEVELILYEDIKIGDGRYANNPWLQELPDPISKVCWDNYAAISPEFARRNGLKQGDVILISSDKYSAKLPVLIQPGQPDNTIAIALGYGREKAGRIGNGIGKNVYPFAFYDGENLKYRITGIKFKKTNEKYQLAQTQSHHKLEGRSILKEITLMEYLTNFRSSHNETEEHNVNKLTFYPRYKYDGHHWGMVIDLNACIGCGACVIACQVENNIPVVGRDEVIRKHEMHWIRIDRYYTNGDENPDVAYQPMMCQHCDNAPCEPVCPVSATMHSSEGLNQQIYNRCIGVRFCENNCPYKVRRFNWYDYTGADSFRGNEHIIAIMDDEIERMVLNPDVTVRSRGVTEKCTFCIQRIQEGKLKAKMDNRPLVDGQIKTACQQACPTRAITFGDMNDPNSKLSKLLKSKRLYYVLDELNTIPSIGYLMKIRNKKTNKT